MTQRDYCPAPAALPRVYVSSRCVYIEWAQFPHGLRTTVTSIGTYLGDVLAWTQRLPDDVVELLVPAEPPGEGPP